GGTLLLTAGWLRAETPETLPEPLGNSSKSNILQQNQPSVESWFDSPHSEVWSKSGDDTSKSSSPEDATQCDVGPAQGPHVFSASSGYCYRDGSWYGDFDFVVWHRTVSRGGSFGVEVATQGGNNQLTGHALNVQGNPLPLQAGARGMLGYFIDRDC